MSTVSNSAAGVQINGAPLTTTVSEANSPLLTNAIDSRITKIRPMATPVDQLSRCGDVRHVGSMKVQYYMADVKSVETTLSRNFDRDDYSDSGQYGEIKIPVNDSDIFSRTETVMIPDIVIDEAPLTVYVTAVENGMITGRVINHIGTFAAEVPLDSSKGMRVVRMGRAAGELDVQTPQYETLPKRNENYCQIFKMQVEESTLHRLSNKEAQWGFSDQEEVAIIDMRQGMEKNFIFGSKCHLTGIPGSEDIYLTGGIWNQAKENTFTYNPDTIDEATLISMCKQAFTGGKGSARKILMGGSDFIEALSHIECSRVIRSNSSQVRWGLKFNEIKSNFGDLFVIHNEIFDQCGHSADAMIIDPNMLTKYVHIPFSTERLDLRSAGTRNTDAIVVTEASCLVLRNPACHMRIVAGKE